MKIIRLTRHPADIVQVDDLRRIFGKDAEIVTISESLPLDPAEAVKRFDEIMADAQVAETVLPLPLMDAILKRSVFCARDGIVIRSVMERELHEDGTATFWFVRYEQIISIEIVIREL